MTATVSAADAAEGADRPAADLPLAGLRIIDLTMVWAGPFATKHLVDLGAEVIKIEGPTRQDLVRSLTVPDRNVDAPWNNSRYFNEYNRNKLGMAIDMQQVAGQAIVQGLVASSDIVIENFRPGVIDRLGLSYESLKKINPRIILVSVPGYSNVEPERGLPGYGPNVEQMGGLAHFNGYENGGPQKSGISYGDPIAGLGGAAAVLMALVQRERTGVGQYIEVGQRNLLVGLIGDAIVAEQLGQEPIRRGNRSRVIAPQGAYACRRDDGVDEADAWLALSVVTDGQWSALCQTMGRPELAAQYPDVVSRQAAHDAIDDAITAWTQTVDARAAADTLQAAGIPASPVLTPTGLREDPQLTARGFLRTVKHPTMGDMNLTAPTWHIRGIDRELIAAPGLGEHNHYVLKEFLGYSDEKIAELEAAGVIATRPRGV